MTQLDMFGAPPAPTRGAIEPAVADADTARLGAALPADVRLGTSSWSFPGWAGVVYRDVATEAALAKGGLGAYAAHPLLGAVGVDPWGEVQRWKLFDAPWANGQGRLIGQEAAQAQLYRALSGFVRDGMPSRLVLLHGPNGSAKSTLLRCIGQALEHYSSLDDAHEVYTLIKETSHAQTHTSSYLHRDSDAHRMDA